MNLYSSLVLLAPERKVSPQVNDDKRIINLRNLFGSKATLTCQNPRKRKTSVVAGGLGVATRMMIVQRRRESQIGKSVESSATR